MITSKSRKREIKDLQRLLLAAGLMGFSRTSTRGKWGAETQAAVLLAYSRLGWDHPEDGKWISTPALVAIMNSQHTHAVGDAQTQTSGGIGGGGSNIGGGGSNIGGGGSNIGGGGSNIGGGGSNIGGGGSNIGGGGSNIGGGGSNIGGGGSNIGGGGSNIGGGGSNIGGGSDPT